MYGKTFTLEWMSTTAATTGWVILGASLRSDRRFRDAAVNAGLRKYARLRKSLQWSVTPLEKRYADLQSEWSRLAKLLTRTWEMDSTAAPTTVPA